LVLADKKEDTIKDKCSFNINDTYRKRRLSDAKISDFDPKMGIFQPFEPISRSKGCSFFAFCLIFVLGQM